VKTGGSAADTGAMDRKILFMCITVGSTIGGYLPTFIGQSQFSLMSIIGGLAGGVAGVWVAHRIGETY
jgi:uncharacterized membrane protein YfcA